MSQQNYPQDEAGQTPWYGGDESARELRGFPYPTGERQTDPNEGGSHATGEQPTAGSQPQGYDAQPSGSGPATQQQYGSQPHAQQEQPGSGSQPQGSQPVSGYDQQVPSIVDPRTGEIHPVSDLNHLQETDALLVVVSGPDAGAQILLDTDVVTVGRSPNADIFLDDVTVSRRHAEFVRTPSGFTLRDTGSLNGTYVGRQLIDSIELQNGADVQIGKFRMIFQQRPRSS